MNLNTVQEIERAIDALTPTQRDELCAWLDERYPQPVDVGLKSAIEAGRFDERINRAIADHKAGNTETFVSHRSHHAPHRCGLLAGLSGVAR